MKQQAPAAKFGVGDEVVLVETWYVGAKDLLGKKGRVTKVLPGTMYDGFRVDFGGGRVEPFSNYELSRAPVSADASEMRSLASWVLSDGTHGEPARTLAKYLLEVVGEDR